MKIAPKDMPVKSRLRALDITKGLVMIIMASLHSCAFFSERLIGIPFRLFDPFVFSTFLLCFGIGNGLSRRTKQVSGLNKLLLVYLIGGLPSATVIHLLNHKEANINMINTIIFQKFVSAITLQSRLEYADFLVPFIVTYTFFLGLQFMLKEFNYRSLTVAFVLSCLFYTGGYALVQIAPDSYFKDFYNAGFRSLQSMPIFIVGVCLGLFLRHNGKIPVIKPQMLMGITLTFVALLVASYWRYGHYIYNGNGWKHSGKLSYLLVSISISTLLIFIIESVIKSGFAQKYFYLLINLLEKIGERTIKCLWIQFLLLPIAGYIVSTSFLKPLSIPLSLVAIVLICWLTVDDRVLWNSQLKKR